MNQSQSTSNLFSVKQMALVGVMTAVICILAPWSIPITGLVPISLGTLAIYFVLYVLGMKLGTLSVLIYILLGAVGIPVFTGFSGGLGKLMGPTGGYIVGYIFLALICGFFIDHFSDNLILQVVGFVLGTTVLYLFGTLWMMYLTERSFLEALGLCVTPFIPGDIAKLIVAIAIAFPLKKRLKKAGLI